MQFVGPLWLGILSFKLLNVRDAEQKNQLKDKVFKHGYGSVGRDLPTHCRGNEEKKNGYEFYWKYVRLIWPSQDLYIYALSYNPKGITTHALNM